MVDCSVQLYGHWLEPGLLFPIKPLKSFTPNNLSAPFKRFSLGRRLQRAPLPGPSEGARGNSAKLLHGDASALLGAGGRTSPSGDEGTRGHGDEGTRGHTLPCRPPARRGPAQDPAVAMHPGRATPQALGGAGVSFIEVSSPGEQRWAPSDAV